jgi:SAM-dependent methyltransferase
MTEAGAEPEVVFDRIGAGYAARRQADPRIARSIDAALDRAGTVVNVGAGPGSYEPLDRRVVAVEPSFTMIGQRSPGAAPCVQGRAEHLPFRDGAFDAALAVLTLHHWTDRDAGLAELARVSRRRVVILTWDPAADDAFWLTSHYLPEIVAHDRPRFAGMAELARGLPGRVTVTPVPVPHDCRDGFLGAFWRRPEAYLDPAVRSGMSPFGLLPATRLRPGLARLAADLASGRWAQRFGSLLARDSLDLGYRLVIADRDGAGAAG